MDFIRALYDEVFDSPFSARIALHSYLLLVP